MARPESVVPSPRGDAESGGSPSRRRTPAIRGRESLARLNHSYYKVIKGH